MIICFDCSHATKLQLDSLVGSGKYASYADAIAVAVGNQTLLEGVRGTNSFVLGANAEPSITTTTQVRHGKRSTASAPADMIGLGGYGIPPIFSMPSNDAIIPVSGLTRPGVEPSNGFPLTSWIFGQFNKLLPAKFNCRAIANLSSGKSHLELYRDGRTIAREARVLGHYLVMLERRVGIDRDARLSTAFPLGEDEDRSIERFASQFVGSMSKSGELSGLLSSLGLISAEQMEGDSITLSRAGLELAMLESPLLDVKTDEFGERYSAVERAFLLNHIRQNIPQELFAYTTILNAISDGMNTPTLLSTALAPLEDSDGSFSAAYFATQRSGAVSRMADLGLISRRRHGVNVSYFLTELGRDFLRG